MTLVYIVMSTNGTTWLEVITSSMFLVGCVAASALSVVISLSSSSETYLMRHGMSYFLLYVSLDGEMMYIYVIILGVGVVNCACCGGLI